MKLKNLLFGVCALGMFAACDDQTDTLGTSLTNKWEHVVNTAEEYPLSTRSISAGKISALSAYSYLGAVRDPETGGYVSANYTTQFHIPEDFAFPELSHMVSRDANDKLIADSCEIRIYIDSYYGDSLASMKLSVNELNAPLKANETYSLDFNPKTAGFIRTEADGGFKVNKSYTLEDLSVSASVRNDDNYAKNIRVFLGSKPSADEDKSSIENYDEWLERGGKFGTYLLRKYYSEYKDGDPENYKNSIRFANRVLPGVYVESVGGLGNIAKIASTQINVYFQYKDKVDDKDTVYTAMASFAGTPEVIQRTNIDNADAKISEMLADESCTYLKTPAGIFTEISFPVDDVMGKHEGYAVNSAKFSIQRLNNEVSSDYHLDVPANVVLVPVDSLDSFFASKKLPDNKASYLATYSSSTNAYTFNNVATLIEAMWNAKKEGKASESWNKAVLVPVDATYNSSSNGYTTTTVISKVSHGMSLSSTRLVGGPNSQYGDIKLSVIYSKYE